MKFIQGSFLLLIVIACASTPKEKTLVAPQSGTTYVETIKNHTKFYRKYDGFYESFRAYATILSPEVRAIMVKQQAAYMGWDSKTIQAERDRAQQETAVQTQFFVQFYTPDPEYDDLAKPNSIWHIYLEIDGRKFEGKVKKARGKRVDYHALYPDFDNFSTPYEITFNISTADTIRHKSKLILASSVGDAEFEFDATE